MEPLNIRIHILVPHFSFKDPNSPINWEWSPFGTISASDGALNFRIHILIPHLIQIKSKKKKQKTNKKKRKTKQKT